MSGLKVQCVEFRGLRKIYWQKWNVIIFILFSLMYNHRKLRIIGLSTLELVFFIFTDGAGPLWIQQWCLKIKKLNFLGCWQQQWLLPSEPASSLTPRWLDFSNIIVPNGSNYESEISCCVGFVTVKLCIHCFRAPPFTMKAYGKRIFGPLGQCNTQFSHYKNWPGGVPRDWGSSLTRSAMFL